MWFHADTHLDEFSISRPIKATSMATTIEFLEKDSLRLIEEIGQAGEISSNTVIVVVSAQLGIQLRK